MRKYVAEKEDTKQESNGECSLNNSYDIKKKYGARKGWKCKRIVVGCEII